MAKRVGFFVVVPCLFFLAAVFSAIVYFVGHTGSAWLTVFIFCLLAVEAAALAIDDIAGGPKRFFLTLVPVSIVVVVCAWFFGNVHQGASLAFLQLVVSSVLAIGCFAIGASRIWRHNAPRV